MKFELGFFSYDLYVRYHELCVGKVMVFYEFSCTCRTWFFLVQSANGLGLQALSGEDYCKVTIKFPSDTIPKWVCFSLIFAIFEACVIVILENVSIMIWGNVI